MSASEIRAGSAFVELFIKDSKLRTGLRAAQARLNAWGASVRSAGVKLAATGGILTAVFGAALHKFAGGGAQLYYMSQKTGIAAAAMAELSYAAEQSGTDLDFMEMAVRNMQKAIGEAEIGFAGAAEKIAELGLSLQTLKQLSPDQQLQAVADRLAKVSDPARRAAIAVALFGRGGTQLILQHQLLVFSQRVD